MIPESFHFLRPVWLLAVLLLLPALWLAHRAWRSAGPWSRLCDPELLQALLQPGGGRAARWSTLLFALAWVSACVALAGPTWERLPQPAYRDTNHTVLALELTTSMHASDVVPSRLSRARFEILDALERVEGSVGVVVFAEEPYAITPLVEDSKVVAEMVPLLSPDIMPGRGTRVDRALDEAHQLLVRAGAARGQVLLLADGVGEAPEAAAEAAERIRAAGFRVSVLGVGGDAEALSRLAAAGGGAFSELTPDDADLERVLADGSEAEPLFEGLEASGMKTDLWQDMGAWLLFVPILIAPLAFRRGFAASLGLLLWLGSGSTSVQAASLTDWFQRSDQQAARTFAEGDPAGAADLFDDPAWQGVARYRAGDYAGAVESLTSLEGATSRYNLGNALAHAGRLEEALEAYDRTLEIEPEHEDAIHNRELVERLLEQQPPPEQESQSSSGEAPDQDPGEAGEQSPQQEQDTESGESGESEQSGESEESEGSQGDEQGESADSAHGENASASAAESSQGSEAEGAETPDSTESTGTDSNEDASQDEHAAGAHADPGSGRKPEKETAATDGNEPGAESEGLPDAPGNEDASSERRLSARNSKGEPLSEHDQEIEQLLNRIPDDPAGLLREKLRRRYAEGRYRATGGRR
jgi:Ca-activated chloride channel family protein